MARLIRTEKEVEGRYTEQWVIVEEDAEVPVDDLCIALCRYVAGETAGIYQVDGEGFFTADGKMIVAE